MTIDFKSITIDELIAAHTYFLINEEENILEVINMRHYLNNYLLKFADYIGCGITSYRMKKGYATEIL